MKKALIVLLCLLTAVSFAFAEGQGEKGGKAAPTAGTEELVNGRFTTTRTITVEIWDRGGTPADDNIWTDYIKEGMLRDHNVEVIFKPVPRWQEVQVLNNLLAAGEAPDVCYTYDYPTIQTYANMGGVLDLAPLLDQYKPHLKALWDLLGDEFIYFDQDPVTGTLWAIEGIRKPITGTVTFIRQDWLKKLGLKEPTTRQEFERTIRAFRDNAETLLGKNADKMIPFLLTVDVAWYARNLIWSFIPDKISDEEYYIYGFDDRNLLHPGTKEAIRLLNKWYNEGLIWKDFPLYPVGDPTADNLAKAGYVGAFIQNHDYPYRGGEDSIHANLKRIVGPDAAFVAIDTFKNDAGKYRKYSGIPVDRKIFFPASNKEPLASLLYVNWISDPEKRRFLQIGQEGTHHEVLADGSIRMLKVEGELAMHGPFNYDYTITLNGLDLGDPEITRKSMALGYPEVEPELIVRSLDLWSKDLRLIKRFNVGEIKAEEGMGPALSEKRNNLLVQSVIAKPSDFDKVFDQGMGDYLSSGGQAIIDERKAKMEQFYGYKAK